MSVRLINHNGTITEASTLLFGSDDRLVRYGDGLFESIRAFHGRVLFPEAHYARLCRGAEALQLPIPTHLTAGLFENELRYLLSTNALQHARLRFVLYRNGKGLYTPDSNEAGYLIEATASTEDHYTLNPNGLRTGIYTGNYKSCTPMSSFKTNNSLLFVLASLYRQQMELDECFIINQKGLIAEAVSSNVFMVKDGKLITPAAHQGCILGVMRSVVLQLAHEAGIPVWEGAISLDDLLGADEVFLTNASMGIQWVQSMQERLYSRQVSLQLHEALNKQVL